MLWCFERVSLAFLDLKHLCQVSHSNKFFFYLYAFLIISSFHFSSITSFCCESWSHSISLHLLLTIVETVVLSMQQIALVNSNSRCWWIRMRSSLCLLICHLQIQRDQRLSDFWTMSLILLTTCLLRNAMKRLNIERASRLHHCHSELSTILLFLLLLHYSFVKNDVKKYDDLRVSRVVLLHSLNLCLKKRTMITISTIFFSYDHTQISSITIQIRSSNTSRTTTITKRKSHVCSIEEIEEHTRERSSNNAFEFEELISELDVTTKVWILIIWSLAKKTWYLTNIYCLNCTTNTTKTRVLFAMSINTSRSVIANSSTINTDIVASTTKSHRT